jgi:hypothetical protein
MRSAKSAAEEERDHTYGLEAAYFVALNVDLLNVDMSAHKRRVVTSEQTARGTFNSIFISLCHFHHHVANYQTCQHPQLDQISIYYGFKISSSPPDVLIDSKQLTSSSSESTAG